ncbi:MAG TPA: hypothetical protein VJN95_12270 [Gemmatimonadales bacterium]|nr:hypothetical protein [Gemmatimonadales bacterium]
MGQGGSGADPRSIPRLSERWAAAVSFAAGFGGWIAVSSLSHRREAWDSPLYWSGLFPILLLLSAILGFFSPERAWRWGLWMAAGQLAIMFLREPSGSLLPLGVILFSFLGAVAGVPALIASQVRRRLDPPPPAVS